MLTINIACGTNSKEKVENLMCKIIKTANNNGFPVISAWLDGNRFFDHSVGFVYKEEEK